MIEEALKPIGVWLLFGRRLTPAAGFAAGALSGAGYALIESLALTSSGEAWSSLVLARTGTSAVHILTAGLTGWALVLAWQKRRFLPLLLAYLCAVMIHGLWNGLTLMYSFNLLINYDGVVLDVNNCPCGWSRRASGADISGYGLFYRTGGDKPFAEACQSWERNNLSLDW